MQKLFTTIALALAITPTGVIAQQLSVARLRCTSVEMPVGVESGTPGLSWEVRSVGRGVLQTAYRVLVSDNPALLQKDMGDLWDSRRTIAGTSINVAYKGAPLKAAKTYYWKVMVWDNQGHASSWSPVSTWQMGLLRPEDWKGAAWIAYEKLPDTAKLIPGEKTLKKGEHIPIDILPLFRKNFIVSKPVRKATAYICGLGQFELSVNGEKTGDHFLDPGWTRFDKEALYVPLDVTDQLKAGENTLGIALGNGFFYIPTERYRKLTGVYGYPEVIGLVRIEYTDGTTADIVTDSTWRTAPSPVVFSSIYGGEDDDGRLEQAGWNTPSFPDASWRKAIRVDGPSLHAQHESPLRVSETFHPQSIVRVGALQEKAPKGTDAKERAWTYDLGQNISGIVRITVRGHKGDTVRIIPGELINEDGSANQRATGSPYYFTYILKGEGEETWQPRFSYYGFRYLQVEGAAPRDSAGPGDGTDPGDISAHRPVLLNIEGLHTSSEGTPVGTFTCSSDLFNRTNELIRWSIRNNMASVLTDCPHREKLGWLEQTHLMGNSVQYNYDLSTLYRKTVHDMMVSQLPDGLVPEIAPEFTVFGEPFRDSPEWGSASIILPWNLYQWYGDKGIVGESYSMMKRYMTYLGTKANGYLLTQGLGDWYDLGPAHPGVSQLTPQGLTPTAFYYYDATILQKVAALLGKTADVQQYGVLAGHIRRAFNDAFFHKDSAEYGTGSQTANAIAVYMKLVDPAFKKAVVDNIVADIRSRHNGLTAGDIGYHYLLKVLAEEGRGDVIFDMNDQSASPGYGYQLARGATALTESWQALSSVSNDHLMLGHIMEWFYEELAGIRQQEDGVAYNHIDIRPTPVGDITSAGASYLSAYGTISSKWTINGGDFALQVVVPANTTAVIELPETRESLISEGGTSLKGRSDVQFLRFSGGRALVRVGSGSYSFAVKPAASAQNTGAGAGNPVPDSTMNRIYNEVKTPYKYGLVIVPGDNDHKVDCPTVFRKGKSWFMTYLVFNGRGYETWLAKSPDLLHWSTQGKVLSFSDTADWDINQKAGYVALEDNTFGGSYQLQKYKGRYWMSYFGGQSRGYEKGLLSIGIAYTDKDPSVPHEWKRLGHPVLSPADSNVSWWDNHVQYKEMVIWDKTRLTGYPFVMYYNANGDSLDKKRGAERIGMAVSDDMTHWRRFGKDPVLNHGPGITGDPDIQKIGNVYVMFYFGAFWKTGTSGVFNRFACSYDLVHWTDWTGAKLIQASEPYDTPFAHKSFVVKSNGVVYHFYCAVDKAGQRGIALAASKDMGESVVNFVAPPVKIKK